ncbi:MULTISPECIES: 5-formyltetrahydrofolate cyclo-ligase [Shouchella]|uniref:5-formyltetrahydrofolate cyclo-ligase n=2 Tax=Shouchella TaxID=2893057 RepID=A0ABY7W8P9_9BACI|nr:MULTISPECIES: 5-formyltetrahydrofolate cyclo-ligase [Shouchella]MED4127929.1 5-formyltetrahydrofolate cyclo-ligase [Shouchella miscanthi]WDF03075.1 5-formyltetrahydrofolate cyclo-ligase [Shouchella hunanensis]
MKQQLRQRLQKQLEQMNKTEYLERSQALANQLYRTKEWKQAGTIGLTYARFPEVATLPIMEYAYKQGKKVALPRTNMKAREMHFYFIQNLNQLELRPYNLYEPKENQSVYVSPKELDLLIVPGLAFSKDGSRLGMGGGFYDRYLPLFKGKTVSLCFNEQLIESIPTEAHDMRMDLVLSEKWPC